MAFFNMNWIISVIYLGTVVAAVLLEAGLDGVMP